MKQKHKLQQIPPPQKKRKERRSTHFDMFPSSSLQFLGLRAQDDPLEWASLKDILCASMAYGSFSTTDRCISEAWALLFLPVGVRHFITYCGPENNVWWSEGGQPFCLRFGLNEMFANALHIIMGKLTANDSRSAEVKKTWYKPLLAKVRVPGACPPPNLY